MKEVEMILSILTREYRERSKRNGFVYAVLTSLNGTKIAGVSTASRRDDVVRVQCGGKVITVYTSRKNFSGLKGASLHQYWLVVCSKGTQSIYGPLRWSNAMEKKVRKPNTKTGGPRAYTFTCFTSQQLKNGGDTVDRIGKDRQKDRHRRMGVTDDYNGITAFQQELRNPPSANQVETKPGNVQRLIRKHQGFIKNAK